MCQKYQKIYDQIIDRAKERKLDCYSEWHHILPRSLGGGDEDSNLVQLTYREHFLAHWLLTKFVLGRGRRAMIYALQCMGTMDSSGQRFISSWQYDVARRTIQGHFESVRLKKMDLDRKNLEIYYQQIGLFGAKRNNVRTNVVHRGKRIYRNVELLDLASVHDDVSNLDIRKDKDAITKTANLILRNRRKPLKITRTRYQ